MAESGLQSIGNLSQTQRQTLPNQTTPTIMFTTSHPLAFSDRHWALVSEVLWKLKQTLIWTIFTFHLTVVEFIRKSLHQSASKHLLLLSPFSLSHLYVLKKPYHGRSMEVIPLWNASLFARETQILDSPWPHLCLRVPAYPSETQRQWVTVGNQ